MKKDCKKQIKKNLEQKKEIKRKGDKLYVNRKVIIIQLIVGLIKEYIVI